MVEILYICLFSYIQFISILIQCFWQESAIFLAKLLLPQMFESWAMKDLRALVTYRSTMREYIRGEKFEMHQQCIGILLDGSIKSQSLHELITSPAVILPPSANQGLCSFALQIEYLVSLLPSSFFS